MWGGMAAAGGYVAPVVALPAALPPAAAPILTGGGQAWWLMAIPLLLFLLAGRGGSGGSGRGPQLTPVPTDHPGPCFGEGTLIRLERGWVPVEAIEAGERIVTSRGVQTILTVESWRPVEFRDRPFVVEGVRLSANHGVAAGEIIVPASRMSAVRSRIDGSRYFHILVTDHAWLFAKAGPDATVIRAESLCMTADLKLARTFPDLVARHAAEPVSPIRVGAEDRTTHKAA